MTMDREKQMAVRTGALRRDAYRNQAQKEGLTLSKWVAKHLDKLVPKTVARKLPPIRNQGRPKPSK